MSEKFSFKTAEELISVLNSTSSSLESNNDYLLELYKQLKVDFNDPTYEEYYIAISNAYDESAEIINCIKGIVARLENYKDELYKHYIEDLIEKIILPIVVVGFYHGKKKRKNKQLKQFSECIKEKLIAKDVPYVVKLAYMRIGSSCNIMSSEHTGVAYFDPIRNGIVFNLEEDIHNECGSLSTYFHEVGHMIDFNASLGKRLSDDKEFIIALHDDCKQYVSDVMTSNNCTIEAAYRIIKSKLMIDNNLYADVSDIMGALTDGKCQNLWGHSRDYWTRDKNRLQREAFANMYSTSMQGKKKIEVMKEFFPTALERFEKLLEVTK